MISLPIDATSGKEYEYYIKNGEAILTKYVGESRTVTVPSKIAGYDVTKLEGTFYDNDKIEKVEISEGITVVGEHTFSNCDNLVKVNLPDTITRLKQHAFSFSGIKKITLPEKTTYVGISCFYQCEELTYIYAKAERVFLDQYALAYSSIRIMQLKNMPQYYDNTFTDECKFSYNPVTTFLMKNEPLYSIARFVTNQPLIIEVILLIAMAILLFTFVVTVIYLVRLILVSLKKDLITNYKKYNKDCYIAMALDDKLSYIRFKKVRFLRDKLKVVWLIALVLIYIMGWLFISLYLNDLFNSNRTILLRMLFLVGTLVVYVFLTYKLIKWFYKLSEYFTNKFGLFERTSVRVRKIKGGNRKYD